MTTDFIFISRYGEELALATHAETDLLLLLLLLLILRLGCGRDGLWPRWM